MKKKKKNKQSGEGPRRTDTGLRALWPRLSEIAFLLMLGCAPLVFLRTGGAFENNPKMVLLEIGAAVAVLLLLPGKRTGTGAWSWNVSLLDVFVLCFYMVCWVSLCQTISFQQAVPQLLHWGACVILYFYLAHCMRDAADIKKIFFVSSLSLLAVCVIGIMQQHFNVTWVPQVKSPASTFGNRNMASQFVVMCFPLAVGALVAANGMLMRTACTLSLISSIIFLAYTRTRSAWLAVFVVIGLITLSLPFFRKQLRARLNTKTVLVTSVLVVVICGAALLLFSRGIVTVDERLKRRIFSMTDVQKGSANKRLIYWSNTLVMVRDNFWGGVGLKNFKLNYPVYHRAAKVDWTFGDEFQLTRVHNDHLQMLVELGAPGFCAYSGMFVVFMYLFWVTFRRADPRRRFAALSICLCVVSFCVIACFTFPLERAMPPVYLFVCFGLMSFLAAPHLRSRVAVSSRLQVPVRGVTACVLVLFVCVSCGAMRNVILSDFNYGKAVNLFRQGNINGSNRFLKAAIGHWPWNERIHLLLAGNYAAQGNHPEAVRQYERVLRFHPYNFNAMLNAGFSCMEMGKTDEAERYFKKGLSILPDSPKAYNNLGCLYLKHKEYNRAIQCFKRAVSLARKKRYHAVTTNTETKFAQPHLNLGAAYIAQNRLGDAIGEYEKALQLDPGLETARKRLALLYQKTGNMEKARQVIQPLLKKLTSEQANRRTSW